jgi:hypothetical protein
MKIYDSIEKLNEYEIRILLIHIIRFAQEKNEANPITILKLNSDSFVIKLGNGQEFKVSISEVENENR